MTYYWSDEDKKEAKRLWDETTMTKRQIGAVFGVTMSAIIGLRYREGWGRRPCDDKYDAKYSKKTPEQRANEAALKKQRRIEAQQKKDEEKRIIREQKVLTARKEAEPKLVHMFDIRENQCRNIIGEPKNLIMCGRRIHAGSYCKHHAKINFTPSNYKAPTTRSFVGI